MRRRLHNGGPSLAPCWRRAGSALAQRWLNNATELAPRWRGPASPMVARGAPVTQCCFDVGSTAQRCSKISVGLGAELRLVGAAPFGRSSSATARHHSHVARVDSGMGRLRHCADTAKRACRSILAAAHRATQCSHKTECCPARGLRRHGFTHGDIKINPPGEYRQRMLTAWPAAPTPC